MPSEPVQNGTREPLWAGLIFVGAAVLMIVLLVLAEGFRMAGPLVGLACLAWVAGWRLERWRAGNG